ncbi:MAG: EAL domain-containing protein [Planctomycetes bacterium]|nr:EAL domain-containing protein [Planctomycetota bacterium]
MNRASMREEIEEIHFHYQLIWSQETNVAVGYECLMRSNSPHFRSPRSFIFEVTRLGLSKALNHHLDDLAVSYIEKLPACGSIFLNAAYVDLQHILHSKIADYADQVVIDFPKYDSEAAFENGFDIFDRLRSKGFRIAIDDAGTAGDDLSLILHVRPDFVKIDHALVRNVHLHEERQELIRLFVSYFDLKGIVAIAEGVEKEAEANMLQSLGIDQMQGFFFAPPSIQAPRTPVYKYQGPEPTRRIP